MTDLTSNKFDASLAFKLAFQENVKQNGLDNTMTQFKALANIYSPDFYIDITAVNTTAVTETN